jgi:CDGSH-type Zn-finger protein
MSRRIEVLPEGPLKVTGSVPLRTADYVYSEHGEPMTWKPSPPMDAGEEYYLCRCGASGNRPYCDGSHHDANWDATESAPTNTFAERAREKVGTGLTLLDDTRLCMHAGLCGTAKETVWQMLSRSDDSIVRGAVIRMAEKCPSGRLVNVIDGDVVEPSLPEEINVVPGGPLWVTGGVPVDRSDGEPFETRNRVTLCRCGASARKPLCDGAHKKIGFEGIT